MEFEIYKSIISNILSSDMDWGSVSLKTYSGEVYYVSLEEVIDQLDDTLVKDNKFFKIEKITKSSGLDIDDIDHKYATRFNSKTTEFFYIPISSLELIEVSKYESEDVGIEEIPRSYIYDEILWGLIISLNFFIKSENNLFIHKITC